MKKTTAFILIISLLLCLPGCEAVIDPQSSVLGAYGQNEQETETETDVKKTEMSALYYEDMDTNPVTTDCYANSELLKLVYSPLIRTDGNFKPYCVLAQSYAQDGLTVTVTLRSDIVFSDGTPVTASDVVKSFAAAEKSSTSPYNRQTDLFERYYAQDDMTFVCVLKDSVAESGALLDIPVMKNGESGIGCGPYVFSEINGKDVLVVNDNYYRRANVPVIYLTETKNDENITSLFSAGELDIILAAQSSSLSLTSLRDYSIISYPSNNLIYIGMNFANEKLADPAVRQALWSALDRESLAAQTLVGLADAAEYPVNPNWYRMQGLGVSDLQTDAASVFGLSFSLLISSGSDLNEAVAGSIKESLEQCGVTVSIESAQPADFEARIQSGQYDMYLGQTAVSRTMDPTFLYGTGAAMNYSGFSNADLDTAFDKFERADITLLEYLDLFCQYMPIIPVVFRKNVIYCDKNITGFTLQSPWNSLGDFVSVVLT